MLLLLLRRIELLYGMFALCEEWAGALRESKRLHMVFSTHVEQIPVLELNIISSVPRIVIFHFYHLIQILSILKEDVGLQPIKADLSSG